MACRSESKNIMSGMNVSILMEFSVCLFPSAAGVPCVPGYHGDNQDSGYLYEKAQEIGMFILSPARAKY